MKKMNPTLGEFAETLYKVYWDCVQLEEYSQVQRVFPIANTICSIFGWKYADFEVALGKLLKLCLTGMIRYHLAIHQDMTPREYAGWIRRKRENQIWVDDYPVFLIEMKKI